MARSEVFIALRSSVWHYLDRAYREALAQPDTEVYCIPADDNDTGYPADVTLTPFASYDFEGHRPARITIQHTGNELPDIFHPERLKARTDHLRYIPSFALTEIDEEDERGIQSLQYFVPVPAVICADEVITQSEQMRALYIEMMTAIAGEETRALWQQKILGTGTQTEDKKAHLAARPPLPAAWETACTAADGSRKKLLLFYNCVSQLLFYGEGNIRKLWQVLDTVRERKEHIALVWRQDREIADILKAHRPALWDQYRQAEEAFCAEDFVICDTAQDPYTAAACCDAFYGDPGREMHLCVEMGKPVMQMAGDVIC